MKYPCEFLFQVLYIVRFIVSRNQEKNLLTKWADPGDH